MEELSRNFLTDLLGSNIYTHVISGLIFGILLGLIPFYIASKRGHREIGIWALIICTVASAIFGPISALPLAAIFIIVASLKKHEEVDQ